MEEAPPARLRVCPPPPCSMPIVVALSTVQWQLEDAPPADTLPIGSNTTAAPPPSGNSTAPPAQLVEVRFAAIRPNALALQWMLLGQLIFPLCIYAVFLFICIKKSFKIPRVVWITVAVTIAWSIIVCTLLHIYNVAFWWVDHGVCVWGGGQWS